MSTCPFQAADAARRVACEVLGAELVMEFDREGVISVDAINGHSYYIFKPVSIHSIGGPRRTLKWRVDHGEVDGSALKVWLLFGFDQDSIEGPSPREHFFSFKSEGLPVYSELLSIVADLRIHADWFLGRAGDPLYRLPDKRRDITDRLLEQIGKTLTVRDYTDWMTDPDRVARFVERAVGKNGP